ALIKEVKEMKEIFEELEAEVDQNVRDRKYDEIERKNLLIENENDTPEFDSVFEINKMKASLQGKDNTIRKLKVQISQLKETRSEADRTLDFRALDFQITSAKTIEKTTALLAENENLKAQIIEKMKYVTMNSLKPKVLAPGMYAFNVEPIIPRNRNNR
ncbi:hypothetical protein Tco_0817081, partial [Tanacetum coccineum]